jgi:hypothetical protein
MRAARFSRRLAACTSQPVFATSAAVAVPSATHRDHAAGTAATRSVPIATPAASPIWTTRAMKNGVEK